MSLSNAEAFALLPVGVRNEWLASQSLSTLAEIARGEWWWLARPEQIPPPGNWLVHLILAGRGFGKSKSGSEWLVESVLKHSYDRHGTPTEWLVIAETLSDARIICVEGPAGILRVLNRRKVRYRYIKSPKPMIIFEDSGAKIYCEGADDADVGRGYNAAGGWLDEICIARGELIRTRRGLVPIEEVAVFDEVMTREGWRPVERSEITKLQVPVVDVLTSNGTVRLTPDHHVWVEDRGWIRAAYLHAGDTILSCSPIVTPNRPMPQHSWNGTTRPGTTTNVLVTTTAAMGHSYTAQFGQQSTGPFLRAAKSITSTGSGTITGLPISNFSPSPNIAPSPHISETMAHGELTRHLMRYPHASAPIGSAGSPAPSSVMSAINHSSVPECAPSDAVMPVALGTPGNIMRISVLSVAEAGVSDVYDLTIEGEPEFFAGSAGILVHNCKWKNPKAAWYEGIMPSLRADLLGDHPRVFVTTTPKPVDILREWVQRTDGTVSLVRGSTFDNASNLSQHVVAELKTRYEGTAIGRQELYGELLEAFEGALFSRLDMENHRILAQELPELISICVGVDPNLTGEDDEMGVVVAGRSRDNHIYILADRSSPMTGRDAALLCWRTMAEFGADVLLYENNLGKAWMEQVLRDAYKECQELGMFPKGTTAPMKSIDSKLGKRTRAEPVAMRLEQGRLHMVGRHPELETQCAEFVPDSGGDSPDRMDAMVHVCRHFMAAEKRTMKISSPQAALAAAARAVDIASTGNIDEMRIPDDWSYRYGG